MKHSLMLLLTLTAVLILGCADSQQDTGASGEAKPTIGFVQTAQQSVQIRNNTCEWISGIAIPVGDAEIGFTTMILLVLLVLMAGIANFTSLGRNAFAIEGSEESALLMGLPVARTKIAVYAINGFCSALAGIVMTLYMDSGNPINAIGLELDVIAGFWYVPRAIVTR